MITGRRLSRLSRFLLSGASLLAVSTLGVARATAGTITVPGHVPVTINGDRDWVNIDASDISTYTNNGNTKDGFDNPDNGGLNALGIHVRDNSIISSFVNGPAGNISATEAAFGSLVNNASTQEATATALSIDGVVPAVTNNGVIRAVALAHDLGGDTYGFADAEAAGYRFNNNTDRRVEINSLVNNGSITARARAIATATGTYGIGTAAARASASGVQQFAGHTNGIANKVSDLRVTNGGTIKALATATAFATYAAAHGHAVGVRQEAEGAQTSSAFVANTGSIIANLNITAVTRHPAFGSYDAAFATYNSAIGVDQFAGGVGAGSNVTATVTNAGSIIAQANVKAIASYHFAFNTYANATGVRQAAAGGGLGSTATTSVTNSGVIQAITVAQAQLVNSQDPFTFNGFHLDLAWAHGLAKGVSQHAEDASNVQAILQNTGSILAKVQVNSTAARTYSAAALTYAGALGSATGVRQWADGLGGAGTLANAFIGNTGTIKAVANVGAFGGEWFGFGNARARAVGIHQDVFGGEGGDSETAKVNLQNSGLVWAEANALAQARFIAQAGASATGVDQFVSASGSATSLSRATINNSGVIKAISRAHAQATYQADAFAEAFGIAQRAREGFNTQSLLTNSGTVAVQATATADQLTLSDKARFPADRLHAAFAEARGTGIDQHASGINVPGSIAAASLTNTGQILVSGKAKAVAGSATYTGAGYAVAAASRLVGVYQEADNSRATSATLVNSGSILVSAIGSAFADHGTYADAAARAGGVDQEAFGSHDNGITTVSLTNTGQIQANAGALATSLHGRSTYAGARASAWGVYQELDGLKGSLEVINNGLIRAIANGNAQSAHSAGAFAFANGLIQEFDSGIGGFAISHIVNQSNGLIVGRAIANALAGGDAIARASAEANGISIHADGALSNPITLNVTNNGVVAAFATATAGGGDNNAFAHAAGIYVDADGGTLAGTIVNNGQIVASAIQHGSHGSAHAIGIVDPSNGTTVHITNNGLIKAYAQTDDGEVALATGIDISRFDPFSLAETSFSGKAVITNDGDIWAGISTDGGKTIKWGTAIKTIDAPNPVDINLIDDTPSHIFGNIVIKSTDTINVSQGTTILSGIINPSGSLIGTLDISTTGKLVNTAGDPVNGASGGYVDTLTVRVGGTLGIGLTPDTDPSTTVPFHYPHFFANTANLRGTLFAGYSAGIYADHQVYEDVITAGTRNGVFDKVLDNSALLDTKVRYQGDGTVDLVVDRLAFSAAAGLSGNQQQVGLSLDQLFGTGALSGIFPSLFALNDADYAKALTALSGAEFAQLNQSILWSTGQLNSTITDRMDCGTNWAASAQGLEDKRCFVPGKTNVWARIHGSFNNVGGDNNAPGYDESQMGIYGGADYAFTNNYFVGFAAGYFQSDMNFDDLSGMGGASINYDGLQAALYGGYDDGAWYARGIGSFGLYNGDSHRFFGLTTSPVDPDGNFDASTESFYGEVGKRYALMPQTIVTPFGGLGFAHSNVDGFTEKDPNGTGAALAVGSQSGDSLASVLGVRVEGQYGSWKPEASLAWKHEFLDTVQSVHNAFAAAPGSPSFEANSSDPGRDWAIIGVGTTYSFNPTSEFTVKYDGRFASDYSEHSVIARWDTKF